MSHARVPRATYRLQLSRAFTFAQATEIVPYLARLGVSHVYCSPYLRARAGSPHGYDIVDHNALNPEIGSAEDYERFVDVLAAHGMGQMIDLVPNHMGVGGRDNAWWLDVLENGQASVFAEFFDIDWWPAKPELHGKVLLPFLEDHYGKVLERGLLNVQFDATRGTFSVHYHDHCFPLDPNTYPYVLAAKLESASSHDPAIAACRGILDGFGKLPSQRDTAADRRAQRNRDKEALKQRLAGLVRSEPALVVLVDDAVRLFNGKPGDAKSYDPLHRLLEEQAYRLAYWRVAADEINYRRFFDINTLAALQMHRPEVFAATHQLVLDLASQGKALALRIDHPDGLYDPAGYFRNLREAIAARNAPGDIYLVAEKVLMANEPLPENWPVDGTTGYDFACLATGVLMNHEGEEPLTRLYERVAGPQASFADLLFERKKLVMRTLLSGELMVLANLLDRLSEADRSTRDYTLHTLREALMETIACFPVYRSYATAQGMSDQDRQHIRHAVTEARYRSPAADVSVFDFLRAVLLMEDAETLPVARRDAILDLVMKVQQYTSPVMAKGLEDTSYYCYNRQVVLNEVGSDPRRFGISLDGFHRANAERHAHWPHSLLATSTHDTKRSEDVRARLAVISEIPAGWRDRVVRWTRINSVHKQLLAGSTTPAPDGNDEYLLYQTLLGVWPHGQLGASGIAGLRERVEAYMLKAVREAKTHTSWINPNLDYERALVEFIRALLHESGRNKFLEDFLPFQQSVTRFGYLNSLSQTLLKLTAPGVPDIYQGNEVWDMSLVDPDNRRPVDYKRREALLDELAGLDAAVSGRGGRVRLLLETLHDGRAKLYMTWKTLQLRQELEDVFRDGSYEPLLASGDRADHVCAFLRRAQGGAVVTLAARWFTRLENGGQGWPLGEKVWGHTWLLLPDDAPWTEAENILTEQRISLGRANNRRGMMVGAVLSQWPVALLRLRQ